ncbi:MAG: M20/M25/M40 family metallo-hydrolase [Candidatus Bathyarchaeia archaeon]
MIEVAEKSMLWLKFRTIGKQSHGSRPDLGVNSFKAASYLVTELDKLHQLFNASDHLYNYPISTFEPTMKEANVPNINTIPGEDCFYLDSRILPRYKIDDVLRAVDEKVRSIEERFNVRVEISQIQSVEAPPPTPVEAPVVKALEKAIKEVTGKGAKIMGIGGGTVAAILRRAGLPAVVWSTVDETAHQPNEYCKISNVKRDAKTIAWILLEM